MKLVEGAIRRPVTVSMATIAVGMFGLVALPRLSVELLPELSYPTLTVRTDVRDASPGDIEQFVTRPIEEAVGVVAGLERLHSVSRAGQSEVTLEFGSGTRMDGAALAVREKLDLVQLPREARRPALLRFDPALDPIVRLRLSSTDGNLRRLRRIAEQSVQRELEGIGGVAAVRVAGGEEEEIQVDVDAGRLSAAGLTLTEVSRRLGAENVTLAGGTLTEGRSEYLVRAHNPFLSPEEIATTVLVSRPGGAVRLSDVATVRRGARDREVIARVDGKEAVEIAVYKEGDANTVSVARAVRRRADQLGLPRELSLVTVSDQSRFIEASIRDVVDAGVWGGLLAILVLFAFLRDLRSTLVIGLSIPISVLATFIVMYRMGLSLNLMSLGGLALSIGNLVDNAIVVLESIFRRREAGGDAARAAEEGTRDVARAVTASTLTIVAVFLPLVFVEGLAGQLVRDQALTISFSHLASLVVALTLVPTLFVQLSRRQARVDEAEATATARGGRMQWIMGAATFTLLAVPRLLARGIAWLGGPLRRVSDVVLAPFDRGYGWLERSYPVVLQRTLSRPNRVLAGSMALLVASCLVVLVLPRNLLPAAAHGELRWNVSLPPGTAVAVTDEVLERVAGAARGDASVRLVQTSAGQTDLASFAGGARSAHRGQVAVVMKHAGDAAAEARVASRVREALEGVPGLTYERDEPALITVSAPIEVEVFAHDLDTLRATTTAIATRLAQIDGLSDVEMSLEPGDPEVQISFDRERLASMSLDPAGAALLVRHAVQGEAATQFDDLERKLDVRVRASERERNVVAELANLEVGRHHGQAVPLGAVADVRVGHGPGEIERIGQQRAARVSAQLAGRDLGSAAEDVEAALAALPRAPGVDVRLAGQNRELSGSFGSLQFALLLAVFLVYLVMASQFESLLHPFVILFSLPLAVIGVVMALAATGTSISIMVLIGLVVLVGIVVNNAIVLVDWANQLRKRGLSKVDALIEAGRARLRPILMTMLTTVLGLVPMAIGVGEGAELRAPLAITLIGGMLLSTVLTLVVIPCVYVLFDRSK